MNLNELESYDLDAAVKFNTELNPRLWTDDEHLRPEVREQLLRIADDFAQSLGVTDFELKDVTISGSNAAYTYTPHSDIDLHLVVDLPEADRSEVYRELFDAKKYQYNDMHNITIGGYDVELYVQDARKPHISQGIYSVLNDEWIQVPRRRKPNLDDISTRSKYETLQQHIEQAIDSGDYKRISAMADKIKKMRQAGLEQHGEFGPENLAFKMLRSQGVIERLYKARNAAKDQLLSLDERKKRRRKKARKTWGYFGGYWYPGTAYAGQDHPAGAEGGGGDGGGESIREDAGASDEQILRDFIEFVVKELKIEHMPTVKLRRDPEWPRRNKTFGRYNDDAKMLEVAWGNRHIMDVLRTVAHELTHKRQHEREDVPASAGETGSEYENEANARAGILMRDWARLHPEHFDAGQAQDLEEAASGYIPTKKQAKDPRFSMALTVDIKPGQIGKEANKLKLKTDRQGHPQTARANGLFENLMQEYKKHRAAEDYSPDEPPGPESKPSMPAGTLRVDVSDMYDWYKLGQHISNMKGLGKHDFGAGPPSSIISFGDEDTEHKFIDQIKATGLDVTDIDPADPKKRPGRTIKTDPTYNVTETFDQPYPLTWEKSEADESVDALARLPDGSNLSIMFNQDLDDEGQGIYSVEFWRNNSQEVTGAGDSHRIFATVLAAIAQFIEKRKPEQLYFSANKDVEPGQKSGSRSNLYTSLVRRYAAALGYEADISDFAGSTTYKLNRLHEQELNEDEDLDEVKMSPGALEKFATSPEAKGIRAGFEAELIFRDTQGEADEMDPEPDYDADERANSISQVVEFFQNDEYGFGIGDRQANRLEEELSEKYYEWYDEQMMQDFRNEAEDLVREIYLDETPMGERIIKVLTDGMEIDDAQADRILAVGMDAPRFTKLSDQDAYAEQNPDYRIYLEAADDAETILEEEVETSIEKQDGYYDQAIDNFRENYQIDDDSGFFSDMGLRWMSDIANEFNLDWPVWNMDAGRNDGSRDWEEIGGSLQDAVDMPVKVSSGYHSTARREGQWIIEPDGSLSPDDPGDEAGLEIVSPPMPLLTAIEKLKQVVDWANDPRGGNAYTNSSTGLHMGVSLPVRGGDVDYVKLILFMGDKYVLQQFGREANTYTASALDKLRQNIKGKKSDPAGVIKLLQHGLTELAHKELQKGVGTSKYTSAHLQDGYIEFRSPGGDWLAKADEEIGVLENTMMRFARAMAIAGDPTAERQEYAKKLYKLVTADNEQYADQLRLFSEFSAGTINKEQLKKQWADAVLQKELPGTGKDEYEVYRMDNKDSPDATVGTLYARDYDDAYDQFLRQYGRDINNLDVRIKQPWFDVFDDSGKVVKTIRAKDIDKATERAQYEFGERWNDSWNIYRRPDDTPEPKASPRAQVAKRIVTQPKKLDYNYEIVDRKTNKAVDRFYSASDTEADKTYSRWLELKRLPQDTEDYGYRRTEQAQDARKDSADLQRNLGVQDVEPNIAQNFEPRRMNYELVQHDDTSRVIHRMPNATADEVRAWIDQQEREGMPAGFLRTRVVAEAIDPVSGAGAVSSRPVVKKIDTAKKVQPVEPVFKKQAYKSAIGQAISQRDLENMTSQIQVARRLGDDVNENFADGRVKGKSRPGRVKRAGASCKGSVTDLRARAKKYGGEKGKMYHWCANMKSGRKK